MPSYLDLGLTSPAQESWQAPKGSSVPIPPPPAVAAARPWAPGVDGLTVRRRIRRSTVDGAPLLWIVGAHGGAGASTWAHILEVGDAGTAWPQHVNPSRSLDIVVCCRSTAAGLRAAQDVAIEWASGALLGNLLASLLGLMPPGVSLVSSVINSRSRRAHSRIVYSFRGRRSGASPRRAT